MKKALLLVLLAVLIAVSWRSWRKTQSLHLSAEVCGKTLEGSFQEAAARLPRASRLDPDGVECLALALLQLDRIDEAIGLMAGFFRRTDQRVLLSADSMRVFFVTRRAPAKEEDFSVLSERALAAYPDDLGLAQGIVEYRSEIQGEAPALEALSRPGPQRSPALRIALATHYLGRLEWARAGEVLGSEPFGDETQWYLLEARALAGQGDSRGLDALFSRWYSEGGDRLQIQVHYALLVSLFGLQDPSGLAPSELLRNAASHLDHIADPELASALVHRLIGHLIVAHRPEEALEWLELYEHRWGRSSFTRTDILRSASLAKASEGGEVPAGTIRFRIASSGRERLSLLVSSDPRAGIDAAFEPVRLPPAATPVEVERSLGHHPVRWVVRDEEGGRCASGSLWPMPGQAIEVDVSPGACSPPPQTRATIAPRSDGRRRVAVIVLDCADWRLIRYLQARGDLPFLDWILERGVTAVLESRPPYTAAALNKLVFPGYHVSSFLGKIHQLGAEIEALTFVQENPVGALRWLLPNQQSLFELLGSQDLAVVNLLRNYGSVRTGRQSVVLGPYSRERVVPRDATARALTDDELPLFPSADPQDPLLHQIAADFDQFEEMAGDPELDLLMGRIAALDLLTHLHYAALSDDGQDDGRTALYDVYRYIDRRLEGLFSRLDSDDVLVVMSDHGIRTAMEHEDRAFFSAVGGAVPARRVAGVPDLRGVGRMIAELLGVTTDWPATGIEEWAEALDP